MSNRIIKKLTAFTLCVLLCLSSSAIAFADSANSYTVEEIDNMQLTMPQDITAVTRSSKADDSYFATHSLDYNEVMKSMTDGDIYLQGMDSQQSITVSVSMFENEDSQKIDNYNRLTDSEINDIVNNFRNNTSGTTYRSSTLDEFENDVVWIDFELMATVGSKVLKQYQATTVVGGKSVSVTVQRNDGDVIADDYRVLNSIISSVKFDSNFWTKNFMLCVIAGASVLVIIILIFIVIFVKRARRRRRKNKNAKIIQELATKYTSNRDSGLGRDAVANYDDTAESDTADEDLNDSVYDADDDFYGDIDISNTYREKSDFNTDVSSDRDDISDYDSHKDDFDDLSGPVRSFTDAEIDALLGDWEDEENFNEALFAQEADSMADAEELAESVADSEKTASEACEENDQSSDNNTDNDVQNHAETAGQNFHEEYAEEFVEDNFDEEIEAIIAQRTQPQPIFVEPKQEEQVEVKTETKPPVEQPEKAENTTKSDEESEEHESAEGIAQAEADEFNNDEVLVREEAKHNKFNNSIDFFEEAPKKIMGVISRAEIEDAEEFDVISEVEQKASEVEKESAPREKKSAEKMKKISSGFKSFTTHCGYFATNVRREFKKSQAKKKRKQAEEQRRQRAKAKAERQRVQAQNGGLVQVRSRTDRRPSTEKSRKD